ncbi:transglutaminase domain-containing protein [uncultured Ruminococcus sp.]|uniref:transglutaminase domain-containing protein n=1 Tax=uncultured Ruminococcus sp. TaxID=165186 RepID=UPI0025F0F812|nr:transglutaminase domain-containing protein [uncultured Ruminococcus sp.]
MLKNKTKGFVAAILAFSIVASGTAFNLPFMNGISLNAQAAGSVDPVTYARDYGYAKDTSSMEIFTSGTWKYAKDKNSSSAYLVESTSTGSSLKIPAWIDKNHVVGVSKDLKIAGYITNVDINMSHIENDVYINTLKGILPKLPNLTAINNYGIINQPTGMINSKMNNDCKKVISLLNYEDNAAIANAMEKYVKKIATNETKNCSNDYEKAKVLHDWIVDNHTYQKTVYSYGDWCVFMNPANQAVCDGFARAYTLLLQAAGLEAYYEGFGKHASVIVKIYGDYYHVDISNDVQGKCHTHFLKADSIWCNKEKLEATYELKVDEKEAFSNNMRYIIRRPSKLYSANLYQKHKWDNWNNYKYIINCNTVFGDLNGDNLFDGIDVYRLRDYINNKIRYEDLDSNARKFIDFNHDGSVNMDDYTAMRDFRNSLVKFNG